VLGVLRGVVFGRVAGEMVVGDAVGGDAVFVVGRSSTTEPANPAIIASTVATASQAMLRRPRSCGAPGAPGGTGAGSGQADGGADEICGNTICPSMYGGDGGGFRGQVRAISSVLVGVGMVHLRNKSSGSPQGESLHDRDGRRVAAMSRRCPADLGLA